MVQQLELDSCTLLCTMAMHSQVHVVKLAMYSLVVYGCSRVVQCFWCDDAPDYLFQMLSKLEVSL